MWLLFGTLAILATARNLYLYVTAKDYKLTMAMALSFTALTICADYSLLNDWVQTENWAALSDIIPGMAKVFWLLTIVSISLNIAPVLLEKKRARTRQHLKGGEHNGLR